MIEELQAAMNIAGLKLAVSKCVWMTTWPVSELFTIQVGDIVLERVEEFVLLGSNISCMCDGTVAIQHRVERAWKYFWANKSLFMNRNACVRGSTCGTTLVRDL